MADNNGLTCVPWTSPPVSVSDLSGDLATDRGNDPNISLSGTSALNPNWGEHVTPTPSDETPNSVSGLPLQPRRFYPAPASPPDPPSLKDRSPSTIDQK